MAKILQSPIILPPESISKNTITQQAFSLGRAFAVTFQISSSNLKLIATESTDENGEIITEYTSEPDTDKELGFSIFLTDDTDARTFGASAGRCGWIDYSTKGEVAEGINDNGNKVIIDFKDETGNINTNLDLLLDHVYPENINNLVKNQTPGLKSIFSMLFLSNKTFFETVNDVYGNLYYDSPIVDTDGNVTDFLTGELKPISEYKVPVIIQYSNGKNIHYTVYDFIFEDNPIDILNINYYTFRLLFENHGGILTLEIMKPGETFYRPCMTKELPYNYYGNHNIRFGFGQFTPLFSYNINKKANFNIHNIQLQQSDERPEWLKTLDKELKNLLDMETFNTELLGAENKLVIHTDRISDEQLAAVTEMLERFVPQFIEVAQYNHHIEVSWRDINKYANIKNSKELSEFVTKEEFQNDLTSDGWWVYPLNEFTGSFGQYAGYTDKWFYGNPKLRYVNLYAPKAHIDIGWFRGNSNLKEVWCEAGRGYDANSFFYGCSSLKKITAIFPEGTAFNNFCRGCKELEDVDLSFKDVATGTSFYFENIFSGCILNKVSVLRFVDRLPDSSKAFQDKTMMTLGIHIDHKYDPEVNLALKKADINYEPTIELPEEVTEGKGWTLTVQWNGNPTAATASTFAMGSLIYARRDEIERADGTIESRLDWGHYVTDPTGYETFRSLESAYEYFGLQQEEITHD